MLPAGIDDVAVRGNSETILVVEDDDQARQTFCDALEALNYRVLCAPNGREALDTYEQNHDEIALVLCDVLMPEMGGFALLQALRQRYSSVNVVMLTGSGMEEEMERLRRENPEAYRLIPCRSQLEHCRLCVDTKLRRPAGLIIISCSSWWQCYAGGVA